MILQRKLIPTRRCCLQTKAATEGKMGSAQLNGRRNGSEMRLFPRKAVILIPLAPYSKACFWLLLSQPTKVTHSGANGCKFLLPFNHKGTAYKLKFTRLFWIGSRAPQATPLRILPKKVPQRSGRTKITFTVYPQMLYKKSESALTPVRILLLLLF